MTLQGGFNAARGLPPAQPSVGDPPLIQRPITRLPSPPPASWQPDAGNVPRLGNTGRVPLVPTLAPAATAFRPVTRPMVLQPAVPRPVPSANPIARAPGPQRLPVLTSAPSWLPWLRSGPAAPAQPAMTVPASGSAGGITLPGRQATARSGSQFLTATARLSRAAREDAIFQEIASGNVPDFLRQTTPVHTSWTTPDGVRHTGTFYVAPDYLAVGSNQDFARVPMSPLTAQRLADRFGFVMPTRQMVDSIYDGAAVKLRPQPQPAGAQMMSNAYYRRHQEMIEEQRQGRPLGALTAGHKKDVVLSNRLQARPEQAAIYGWHQPNGQAIQPLSTVHENTYADYSHGVRMIAPQMIVDGRPMAVSDVLRSPQLSGLLSDEGPLRLTRIPRA